MTDIPPYGMRSSNTSFRGNLLLLQTDAKLTRFIENSLPFASEIGWYPYVRVTGYFRAASNATAGFPALSAAFIEWMLPRAFGDAYPKTRLLPE